MIFQNTLELAGFIQNAAINETGLRDLGIWMFQERENGNPISQEERKWMFELMCESLRKAKYLILNETFDFIPDRLKSAYDFKNVAR